MYFFIFEIFYKKIFQNEVIIKQFFLIKDKFKSKLLLLVCPII